MIKKLKIRYLRKNDTKYNTKDNVKQDSIYTVKRNTFGGVIYPKDYDAHYYMSDIAERIASDYRFDEQCRKNTEYKNKNKRK